MKDSSDFFEEIKAVESITPKVVLDDPPGSDVSGTDGDNVAVMASEIGFGSGLIPLSVLSEYPDVEPSTFAAFKEVFEYDSHFPIRGNVMNVQIPFTATIMKGTGPFNVLAAVSQSAGTKLVMTGASGGWGVITQGVNNYINLINGGGLQPNQAAIQAHGDLDEVRTEIVSTGGNVKISTNVNLAAFTVGAELGANFTISTATNIMNHYTMDAALTVSAQGGYNQEGAQPAPQVQYMGGILATDAGILLNQ